MEFDPQILPFKISAHYCCQYYVSINAELVTKRLNVYSNSVKYGSTNLIAKSTNSSEENDYFLFIT